MYDCPNCGRKESSHNARAWCKECEQHYLEWEKKIRERVKQRLKDKGIGRMYIVKDNGKPASEAGFSQLKGKGWVCHEFHSWWGAVKHARNWLGAMDVIPDNLENDERGYYEVDYSGYGDVLTISES